MEKLSQFTDNHKIRSSEMSQIKGGAWKEWKYETTVNLCYGDTAEVWQLYTWWGNYGTTTTEYRRDNQSIFLK